MLAETLAATEAIAAVHCVMQGQMLRFDEAGRIRTGKRSTREDQLITGFCTRQCRWSDCRRPAT